MKFFKKEMNVYIVVFITTKNLSQAKKISRQLIKEKLIACANIVQGVESVFWWQNKVDQSKEVLLIIKTKKDLFSTLVKKVKALHSYAVPEIIALPIVEGNPDYLKWLEESVK